MSKRGISERSGQTRFAAALARGLIGTAIEILPGPSFGPREVGSLDGTAPSLAVGETKTLSLASGGGGKLGRLNDADAKPESESSPRR